MGTIFPDMALTVEDMPSLETIAVRTTLHGIPSAAEEQSSPTMMEIFRIQDGRIAELWGVSTLQRSSR